MKNTLFIFLALIFSRTVLCQTPLSDFCPSLTTSQFWMTGINDKIYFVADYENGGNVYEYSESGGLVKINGTFKPKEFAGISFSYKDALYFFCQKIGTFDIYYYKYSGGGIAEEVSALNGLAYNYNIQYKDVMYFPGIDQYLYSYDGTTLTKHTISGIKSNLSIINNELYFVRSTDGVSFELCKYDGQTLTPVYTSNNFKTVSMLFAFNNELYFSYNDGGEQFQLWKYDGHQIQQITNIATTDGLSPTNFGIYDNKLYYSGFDNNEAMKLWLYDGINSAKTIGDVYDYSFFVNTTKFAIHNNILYYVYQKNPGSGIMKYDGSGDASIIPMGPDAQAPSHIAALSDGLYVASVSYQNPYGKIFKYSYDKITNVIIANEEYFLPKNPVTSGELILENLKPGSTINITDAIGKTVYEGNTDQSTSFINTSEFKNGIYLVKISINDTIKTYKILVSQ